MIIKYPIKFARKYLTKPYKRTKAPLYNDYAEYLDNEANELLRKELSMDKPSMICKFGTTELACIRNYLSINEPKKINDILKYIKREKQFLWWWDMQNQLSSLSGVFPATTTMAVKFAQQIFY